MSYISRVVGARLEGHTRYLLVLGGVVALLLPHLTVAITGNRFWVTVFINIFIFSIAVISFDFVFGYAGIVSFGHALFFGGAAYVVGISTMNFGLPFVVGFVLALVSMTVLAGAIAALSLRRLTGVYFAIVTLAFGQLGYNMVRSGGDLTGGDLGFTFTAPGILGYSLSTPMALYYLSLVMLVVVYVAVKRLVNSPFGRILQGIRVNEERMEALGIDVFRYRVYAFSISGFVAAIGGAFWPLFITYISPDWVHWGVSGDILIMSLVGGLGTLWGAVIGTGLFVVVETLLSGIMDAWKLTIGILFVLFVIFIPGGIAGLLTEDEGTNELKQMTEKLRAALRGNNE